MTVINIVLSSNSVQTVDAFVPALEPFLQMRAGSHELIGGPMKFDTRFPQPFLNVHPPTSLGGSLSPPPRSSLGLFLLLRAESYSKRRRDFLPWAQSSQPDRGFNRSKAKGPLPLPLPLPLPQEPVSANFFSRVFRRSHRASNRWARSVSS